MLAQVDQHDSQRDGQTEKQKSVIDMLVQMRSAMAVTSAMQLHIQGYVAPAAVPHSLSQFAYPHVGPAATSGDAAPAHALLPQQVRVDKWGGAPPLPAPACSDITTVPTSPAGPVFKNLAGGRGTPHQPVGATQKEVPSPV